MKRLLFSCLGLATAASLALAPLPLRAEHRAGLAGEASEHDFLAELPVVLSASRLTQPLADAPGAVTVIDRDMIKASGAREIADLFRLVPGFQVSYANGANPVVAYHGQSGQVNQRMQVLVDGRSAYSPYYLGGVNWNMLSPDLEDIERI
ncbi:MAG: TonB-dependent receptor, partial [Rhodocyclaceae bacterium]|nr:TonB-dependent receptor [Rhodocyclaceae bacterium]